MCRCGFTPQLKELQQLYDTYHSQGLEVIGYPSDQFGSQNPEDDAGTESFCQLNYGVSFPMVNKRFVTIYLPSSLTPVVFTAEHVPD